MHSIAYSCQTALTFETMKLILFDAKESELNHSFSSALSVPLMHSLTLPFRKIDWFVCSNRLETMLNRINTSNNLLTSLLVIPKLPLTCTYCALHKHYSDICVLQDKVQFMPFTWT